MKQARQTAVLALLATAMFFGITMAKSKDLTIGQAAPAFSLPDSNGKTHSLSDYKGKYLVLEWTNPDCPFVVKHYGSENMQGLQKEYKGKGVVWLAVASSAPGKQGHFSAEEWNGILKEKSSESTALLLDPKGKVGKSYGAKTTPHMYVINPEGKLIYQGAIDDKATFDPKDIPSSKNYVKAALDEAMAGQAVASAETKPYGCSVKYK